MRLTLVFAGDRRVVRCRHTSAQGDKSDLRGWEAGNADQAIAILEKRADVRIVFSDIEMPGSMDGVKLARAIRNRWPPIELVLTSGRFQLRDNDIPERGHFFAKPYDADEIVKTLRSFK